MEKPLKYFLLFCLAATTLVTSSSVVAATGDKRSDAVRKMQRSYFDAILRKKIDSAAAMLAPDYVGVYADGIIDRAREIKDLGEFPLTEYKISDEKVRFADSKAAIITFRLHVKVTVDGKDFFEDDNIACVWRRNGGTWQLSTQAAVKVREKK